MPRITALVLIFSCVLTLAVVKADEAPARPVGTWTRKMNGHTVTFTFHATGSVTLKVETEGGKAGEVMGSYGVTADGLLFGVITKVVWGLDSGPEKGDPFSFGISVNKGALILSDPKGMRVSDEPRRLLEGTYSKE